ncbi:MAG: hypothetical protein RLZ53_234 [Actinomycetota bacterium]|jgi:hypothetical protein
MKRVFATSIALFATVLSAIPSSAEGIETESSNVQTQNLPDGGIVSIFSLPDGSTMTVASNLSTDTLTNASAAQLKLYGIPPRPEDPDQFNDWLNMYSHSNQEAPSDSLELPTNSEPYTTIYSGNWGGYLAGTLNVVNTSYVAVKSNFVVPSVQVACTASANFGGGAWVGLGGTNNGTSDLVQQGIGWCNTNKTVNKWTPWTEFAPTQDPIPFCNYTTWAFSIGDVIYNNLSYQSSSDIAYFYMQNQTTGVAHSCSRTAPSSWSFNGNTAECIMERPTSTLLVNYGTIRFTNCQVELGSNSTWYPIGQRSSVKQVLNGYTAPGILYQKTGSLGADDKSFTMTFLHQ